ncbi:Uncharacterised protein [Klebsiella pneumoniae]|nr:Uncharacterised protein [Klebsiella pneumoniae]
MAIKLKTTKFELIALKLNLVPFFFFDLIE